MSQVNHFVAWVVCTILSLCLFLCGTCGSLCAQESEGHAAASVAKRLHVVVVLDDSGSMDERLQRDRRFTRMDAAKRALQAAITSLPADTELGIALLNERSGDSPWIVPLGPINVPQAQQAIQQVHADGGTPLGEFLKLAADELLKARQAHHYGEYRLLLVTDGEANDPELVEIYLPQALARGLSMHVIGVDMDQAHSLATKVHSYRGADDEEELQTAVQEVFAETGGNGSDASEEAFELLGPLDSDVAVAAIAALAESGNEPLDPTATSATAEATRLNNPPAPGMNDRRAPLILIIMLVFGFFVLANMFRAIRRLR